MDATKKQNVSDFQLCPKFEKTFEILGKKWNGLIIDVLLEDGPKRFKDLVKSVNKCSDRVLTERLKSLEQLELIERVQPSGKTVTFYQLTQKGEELAPIMDSVHTWANKWFAEEKDC